MTLKLTNESDAPLRFCAESRSIRKDGNQLPDGHCILVLNGVEYAFTVGSEE